MIKNSDPGYIDDTGLVVHKPNMDCSAMELQIGDLIFDKSSSPLGMLDAKVIMMIDTDDGDFGVRFGVLPILDWIADKEEGELTDPYTKDSYFEVYRFKLSELLEKL